MSYIEKSISSLIQIGLHKESVRREQQGNIILYQTSKTALYLTQSV
jgi:hypothetical protein